jgi:hypothetical protein
MYNSPLVYRLGYGPFKAEGGVRFPDGENITFCLKLIAFIDKFHSIVYILCQYPHFQLQVNGCLTEWLR